MFYSFPVTYIGRYRLAKSLRTVEFPIRNKIVQEAIARLREASGTRDAIERHVDECCSVFLDEDESDVRMEDIVLNISVQGIVLATPNEENVLAHHRMTTISFAAGGDYEDYDQVAYVAKTRMGRMVCNCLPTAFTLSLSLFVSVSASLSLTVAISLTHILSSAMSSIVAPIQIKSLQLLDKLSCLLESDLKSLNKKKKAWIMSMSASTMSLMDSLSKNTKIFTALQQM